MHWIHCPGRAGLDGATPRRTAAGATSMASLSSPPTAPPPSVPLPPVAPSPCSPDWVPHGPRHGGGGGLGWPERREGRGYVAVLIAVLTPREGMGHIAARGCRLLTIFCTMVCLILNSQATHDAKGGQTANTFTWEGGADPADKRNTNGTPTYPLATKADGPRLGLDGARFLLISFPH